MGPGDRHEGRPRSDKDLTQHFREQAGAGQADSARRRFGLGRPTFSTLGGDAMRPLWSHPLTSLALVARLGPTDCLGVALGLNGPLTSARTSLARLERAGLVVRLPLAGRRLTYQATLAEMRALDQVGKRVRWSPPTRHRSRQGGDMTGPPDTAGPQHQEA